MAKNSFCKALKCSICCYFPNDEIIEKDGFAISKVSHRPIDQKTAMPVELYEAGKAYGMLNEDVAREKLSPCLLLDEDGSCRGHCSNSKYRQKDPKQHKKYKKIYQAGVRTEDDWEIMETCPRFYCETLSKMKRPFRRLKAKLFENPKNGLKQLENAELQRKDKRIQQNIGTFLPRLLELLEKTGAFLPENERTALKKRLEGLSSDNLSETRHFLHEKAFSQAKNAENRQKTAKLMKKLEKMLAKLAST